MLESTISEICNTGRMVRHPRRYCIKIRFCARKEFIVEHKLGSPERPVRVAIIGAGPSAFYAADGLLQQGPIRMSVDMFDRKPTPFGLVRDGVAPDHQKIKSVTRVYDKIAAHPEFRFYGNVEMGRDVTHADLQAYYHAIIYAVDRKSVV